MLSERLSFYIFGKLNEAVEKFGSLQKANTQLGEDKLALEKENNQLKHLWLHGNGG